MSNINNINAVIEELQNRFPEAEVKQSVVEKAYGTEIGITLRKPNEDISPCFYIDDESIEEIGVNAYVDRLLDAVNMGDMKAKTTGDFSKLFDFEQVKDKIIARLINPETAAAYIINKPSVQFEDMYITFAIDLSEEVGGENGMASTPVTNDLFNSWGITKEELFEIAKVNMREQADIRDLFGLTADLMK